MASAKSVEILRRVFGYDEFRPLQGEIVDSLLAGEDAFVLMPTGGGKSLCFQIPAMMRKGVGIVVSPLISLMKDQVDALCANGVRAAYYNSSQMRSEQAAVMTALASAKLDLIYVSPERAVTDGFIGRLSNQPVSLIAIDEAHCISQWGHDFRPEYLQLRRLRDKFQKAPFVALTATADSATCKDIIEKLSLENARQFISGFDRPNISYAVVQKKEPQEQLLACVKKRLQQSGIVYCFTRKTAEQACGSLTGHGVSAAVYHAGLSDAERRKVQEAFSRDQVDVVVATIAFGMGIDKPNVRYVVHYDVPKSIESYYQETGRAGRDGLPAEAIMFFSMADVGRVRQIIDKPENSASHDMDMSKLYAMADYAQALTCRRRILLNYFGDEAAQRCGNCDNCISPPKTFDGTEMARNVLMAVYATGQRFGKNYVIDVLTGIDNERIRDAKHHTLPIFGKGSEHSAEEWDSIIRQLTHLGLLKLTPGKYSVLKLTPETKGILRDGEQIRLARPVKRERRRRKSPIAHLPENYDVELFEKLRKTRKQLAEEEGIASYMICGDKTLAQIAADLPTTLHALSAISGIGDVKREKYGRRFISIVVQHALNSEPEIISG